MSIIGTPNLKVLTHLVFSMVYILYILDWENVSYRVGPIVIVVSVSDIGCIVDTYVRHNNTEINS